MSLDEIIKSTQCPPEKRQSIDVWIALQIQYEYHEPEKAPTWDQLARWIEVKRLAGVFV
jgi:hypothetical protein